MPKYFQPYLISPPAAFLERSTRSFILFWFTDQSTVKAKEEWDWQFYPQIGHSRRGKSFSDFSPFLGTSRRPWRTDPEDMRCAMLRWWKLRPAKFLWRSSLCTKVAPSPVWVNMSQHESTWVNMSQHESPAWQTQKHLKKRVIAGSNLCEVRQLLHRRLRMFARREWPATVGAGGSRGCSKIRPHGEAVTQGRVEENDVRIETLSLRIMKLWMRWFLSIKFQLLCGFQYFKCNIMQHGSVLQSQSEQYQLPKTVQLNQKAYVGRCSVDRASSIHRALCGSIWQLGTLSFGTIGTWCFWWSKHQN